ncbi:MAG: protein kinase [Myxococcales bacterium]|nr:protein kinase [Myxococcales bacterium]
MSRDTPVKVGDVIADKYRVERVLGVGGMGMVVAATHQVLDQQVAIKFLLPELAQHPEAGARFQREAKAAVRIQSQHVCRVLDVGVSAEGAPFMVMEYLEGKDLADELEEHGRMAVERAVEYVLQACEALAEAHAAGIVHRDLKPANLFLAERTDGSRIIKVLDFGISKVTDQDVQLTKTSSVMGSPQYMAPEQMQSSKQVDQRTDIWALGAILYELLTNEAPFQGETVPEICINIVNTEPKPLLELRPDLPEGLVGIIERCLKKAAEERFENVAELGAELSEYGPPLSHLSVERASRVLNTVVLGTPRSVLRTQTSATRPSQHEVAPTVASYAELAPPKQASRRPLVVLGIALAILGLGGAVAFATVQSRGGDVSTGVVAGQPGNAPTEQPSVSAAQAPHAQEEVAPEADVQPASPGLDPESGAEPKVAADSKRADGGPKPQIPPEAPESVARPAPTPKPVKVQASAKTAPGPAPGSELDISGFGDRK